MNIHIHTDVSSIAIGALLGQEEGTRLPYAIYYISKKLIGAVLNYTTTKKEFLVVVYSINKFHHYITSFKVFIHIDHSTIQ